MNEQLVPTLLCSPQHLIEGEGEGAFHTLILMDWPQLRLAIILY